MVSLSRYAPKLATERFAHATLGVKQAESALTGGVATADVAVRVSRRIAPSIDARPFVVTGSDPEHALDSADGATDHPADYPPDGTRRVVTDISAVGGPFGNALCLCRKRRRKRRDEGGC